MLSGMCPDGTQCRPGSLDAPDATRCGAWAQDAQDAESRLVESGCNTTVSDAGHLFADEVPWLLKVGGDQRGPIQETSADGNWMEAERI